MVVIPKLSGFGIYNGFSMLIDKNIETSATGLIFSFIAIPFLRTGYIGFMGIISVRKDINKIIIIQRLFFKNRKNIIPRCKDSI